MLEVLVYLGVCSLRYIILRHWRFGPFSAHGLPVAGVPIQLCFLQGEDVTPRLTTNLGASYLFFVQLLPRNLFTLVALPAVGVALGVDWCIRAFAAGRI
jgi:hypothetical protein